jgi:hypothetical protein
MNETPTRYFRAMQHGPDGLSALISLFAEDAVYLEPFAPGGGRHAAAATSSKRSSGTARSR